MAEKEFFGELARKVLATSGAPDGRLSWSLQNGLRLSGAGEGKLYPFPGGTWSNFPSFSFGADRSSGSDLLRPGWTVSVREDAGRPAVDTENGVVSLPRGWRAVLVTGRGLALVAEGEVVVLRAKNASLVMAPEGQEFSLDFSYYVAQGKWGRSYRFRAKVALIAEPPFVKEAGGWPLPANTVSL